MRTVFLGTSDFAVAVLERVAASEHAPALVVTRPDRPQGRGRRLTPPPVARAARALGLPLLQPESVNDEPARREIAAARPGALCVCAFGALIREPLLSDHDVLNVHPSLLPRWRGAAPIERAIMAGDERTGVCIMRLTAGLDEGPVCLREATAITAEDTYGTLAARLAALGGEALVRALTERPPFAAQDETGVTYAEKLTAAERTLDPRRPAVELARVVRALHPHVGARAALPAGGFLGVRAARVVPAGPPPGELAAGEGALLLGTPEGALALTEVQPAGGRPMPAAEYLRGHPLP